jgi:hypothetical protein
MDCLYCKKPCFRARQKYHYWCKKEAEAELRAKIEALPSKPITDEIWERMSKPDPTPFELQQSALRDKPGRQHE